MTTPLTKVPLAPLKKAINQLHAEHVQTIPQGGLTNPSQDLFPCPNCGEKLVMYDVTNQQYLCLNNNKCAFRNNTLTKTDQTLQDNPLLHPASQAELPPVIPPSIKGLKDLDNQIIKEFILNEDKTKLIIKIKGQTQEIHVNIKRGQSSKMGLDVKLVGKKQIITYEEVEETLE